MEADNGPSHLYCIISMFQQWQFLPHKYQCPKFGVVIIKKELPFLHTKNGMEPRNWNIIDSDIYFMSSSNFNQIFLGKVNNMEASNSIFVFVEDFED